MEIEHVTLNQYGIRISAVLWNSSFYVSTTEINIAVADAFRFAEENKLSFNSSKPVVRIFISNKHIYNYQPIIYMNGIRLSYEKHLKYMGFTID